MTRAILPGRTAAILATVGRGKTVLTEVDPVDIVVPRDRDGSFEPRIARKRQRRLSGVEDMVISLSAKGLTTGETWTMRWKPALNAFEIAFEGRLSAARK